MSEDNDILLAQIGDMVDPIVDHLSGILSKIDKTERESVLNAILKEMSSMKESLQVTVDAPQIDLTPIQDAIMSLPQSDHTQLISELKKYNANAVKLSKKLDNFDSTVSKFIDIMSADSRVVVERSTGGTIKSLLIKKDV